MGSKREKKKKGERNEKRENLATRKNERKEERKAPRPLFKHGLAYRLMFSHTVFSVRCLISKIKKIKKKRF